MKQYITMKQWDEIITCDKIILYGYYIDDPTKITIGKMIEFLGKNISIDDDLGQWFVRINCEFINGDVVNSNTFLADELCDALWEACKYKLTSNN